MSIDHAKAFLQELAGNEALKLRILSCTSAEERLNIAKETGFEFTAEEFSDARSQLFDDELDAVSGGECGCGFTCEKEAWAY